MLINKGEITGLSGASGSGKSRLLRALADLDEHQGQIHLLGIDQQAMAAHQWRKKVALLAADTHWWFDSVGLHFDGVNEQGLEPSLQVSLQALGFSDDCMSWDVVRLSSGEKQRLGLLRLLQSKPDVLLLDEPTANLDNHNTALFEAFVTDYLTTHCACALWVSHDTEQLQRVSNTQYSMQDGVLVDAG